MSLRGFWNTRNAANKEGRSVCKIVPRAPAGRVDPYSFPADAWKDHSDREAVARAESATCSRSREPRHDG